MQIKVIKAHLTGKDKLISVANDISLWISKSKPSCNLVSIKK